MFIGKHFFCIFLKNVGFMGLSGCLFKMFIGKHFETNFDVFLKKCRFHGLISFCVFFNQFFQFFLVFLVFCLF